MAITSRAARSTHFSSFTTPDVVGPGSYLRTDRDPTVHGFAPFSSTVERPTPADLTKHTSTPGPGQYSTVLEHTIGRTPFVPNGVPPGAGAAFSSKVKRMPGGPSKSAQPGPGQYSLYDSWQHTGEASGAGGMGRRQMPSAKPAGPPSIPVHQQSFGYEEVGDGELRMQKPPTGGFTGVSGHRSAGPGEYDPMRATNVTKPASVQPNFGNSRVVRAVFSESKDTPGPGAYAAEGSELRAKPSAAFLSRVPMTHQKLIDPEKLVPGPGSYAPAPGITPKVVPENLQAFGSTQKRLASDAVTPADRQRMAQPGPGAYEERRSAFARAMGAKAEAAAAAAAGGTLDQGGGRSGFNSSTVRFQALQKSGKPGPGQYDELDQHSFVAELGRKPHGRNGVFGSTTRRFHTLKKDPVPGAGAYNPVAAGANEADRDEGPNAVFASGVQRFTKSAVRPAPPARPNLIPSRAAHARRPTRSSCTRDLHARDLHAPYLHARDLHAPYLHARDLHAPYMRETCMRHIYVRETCMRDAPSPDGHDGACARLGRRPRPPLRLGREPRATLPSSAHP